MSVTSRGLHEMSAPVITVVAGGLLRLGMACHVGQCRSRHAGEYGVPCVSRPREQTPDDFCDEIERREAQDEQMGPALPMATSECPASSRRVAIVWKAAL